MPASPAAKLVVDASAFVALGADNMQTADVSGLQDQLPFCVGLRFDLGVHRLPFVGRRGGGFETTLPEIAYIVLKQRLRDCRAEIRLASEDGLDRGKDLILNGIMAWVYGTFGVA